MLKKTSLYFLIILFCFVNLYGCGGSKDDELQAALDKNKELEAQLLKKAQEAEATGKAKPPAVSVCNRTPEMQEIILFKVKKTDCKAVTDQDLLAIKTIKSGKRLSALRAEDFSGLSSLVVLDIDFTRLNLSAGLFSHLISLEILILDGFSAVLTSGLLSGLSSLEIIDFDFDTADIPEDLFSGFISLRRLTLDFGNRPTVPGRLLSGLSSLEVFDFSWTILDNVPVELFSGLVNLREIDLYSKNYPEGLFSNLPALKSLDLYHETSETEKQRIQAEVGAGVRIH